MPDRTHLVYREDRNKMTISGELLLNGFVIDADSMSSWDDGRPVNDYKRQQIVVRAKKALESQGMYVEIEP